MANFAGIVDQRTEQRNDYLAALRPRLATFPWLSPGEREMGSTVLAWCAGPTTPASFSRGAGGESCFLLGSLGRADAPHGSDTERLLQLYAKEGSTGISGQNGYYAACLEEPSGSVYLAADQMGLLPVYYYATQELLLFASSPSFFRPHPAFTPRLSIQGLTGILLTTQLCEGRTLWEGVRRLPAAHLLHWRRGKGAIEHRCPELQPSQEHFRMPYRDQVDMLDTLLGDAVRRETAGRQVSILLSGGLDSRLLAGYLSEQPDSEPVAITLGSPTDNEMHCAAGVADRLGWKHVQAAVDLSAFPRCGETCVQLEMLANGLSDLAFFQGIEAIRGIRPQIVTGFAGDSLMGGGHVSPATEAGDRDAQFAKKFADVTRHGFPPAVINRVLRPEFRHCTDGVVTDLRRAYDACEGLPFQQSWMFDIRHRIRHHTAGSVLNRIAYGAWPITPYADKGFVTAVLGMPAATLINRRVQVDLLCRRFPHLAALPLDRNSRNTAPLLIHPWHALLARLRRLGKQVVQKCHNGADGCQEQRYYYRVFDINNPGWVGLRRRAEPFREIAETIFEPEILRELLPPPHEPIRLQDGIIDAAGRKVLLGFMLWAGGNL